MNTTCLLSSQLFFNIHGTELRDRILQAKAVYNHVNDCNCTLYITHSLNIIITKFLIGAIFYDSNFNN